MHKRIMTPVLCFTSFLCACGGEALYDELNFTRESVGVFHASQIEEPVSTSTAVRLKVLAWNIKYGAARIPFWFDCWGDRIEMSAAEVEQNMEGLYQLIKEYDPDIILAEEIEINSRRSAYYNMVQGILDNTKLNYGAYMQTWNSRYIAAEGLGRMNLGNAIFSKYPITKAERIRQDDRTDQDALTAAFYIHRALGRVEIKVSTSTTVAVYVAHTAAYDSDGTKQKHIKQLEDLAKAETLPFVIGGDFNEVPPTATRVEGFPDERSTSVCSDDYTQPPYTPEVMDYFYSQLNPWITLERYGETETEQSRYYTHTVLGPDDKDESGKPGDWSRTLDYLFANQKSIWVSGSTDVIQTANQRVGGDSGLGPVITSDALKLSDHAPVVGTWEVH